jgi:hypothetical protein
MWPLQAARFKLSHYPRKLSRSKDLARLGLAAVVVLELENQIVRLEECDKPVDQWVVC